MTKENQKERNEIIFGKLQENVFLSFGIFFFLFYSLLQGKAFLKINILSDVSLCFVCVGEEKSNIWDTFL